MSNANSEAFIINKCLLSGSLTPCLQMGLLRAVPGPKLKADVGRTRPGDLEEMAGQDWSPPDSDGGWFDTGDSRNRQSICRRTAVGEEIFWILNSFSLGIEEEQPLETLKVIRMT